MEFTSSFSALDQFGGETMSFAPILIVAALLFLGLIVFKMGRKNVAMAQHSTSALSTRLAEINPADYDFDGRFAAGNRTFGGLWPALSFGNFSSRSQRCPAN